MVEWTSWWGMGHGRGVRGSESEREMRREEVEMCAIVWGFFCGHMNAFRADLAWLMLNFPWLYVL